MAGNSGSRSRSHKHRPDIRPLIEALSRPLGTEAGAIIASVATLALLPDAVRERLMAGLGDVLYSAANAIQSGIQDAIIQPVTDKVKEGLNAVPEAAETAWDYYTAPYRTIYDLARRGFDVFPGLKSNPTPPLPWPF